MKKGLKILLIFVIAGTLAVGGALYSILSGKIKINSQDLISTTFAEEVMMGNDQGYGIKFKLLGPGVIEEVMKRLGLSETELKNAWENGQTLLEFVESKGITKEKLIETFKEVITEKINELLKEGKITETEKENFLNNLDKRIEEFITKTPPFGKGPGKGPGFGKDKKPPYKERLFFDEKGIMEDVLSKLNLSLDEFQEAVRERKSLLEFAESKGITKEKLVTVVKEVFTEKVDQLFNDGKITEEQRDKFLENLDEFVERFINGPGFGRGRGHHGNSLIPEINNKPSSNL